MVCRRELQANNWQTFSHLGGGVGDNLMKAIVLIGDKVVGKAIAIRTCIRREENWGLGLRLKKNL